MKIVTITCHDVYNCGASLQAYALQQFLIGEGYEVEIINYKPDYLSFHYRWSWFVNERSPYYSCCRNNVIYRFLYVTQRYLRALITWGRKGKFEKFTHKYLKLTREYDTYTQICRNPPEADVYIVGSDQVWNNAGLNNGFDPAFFLTFGDKKTKRISYAPSFGTTESYLTYITEKRLSIFDGISVRGEHDRSIIAPVCDAKIVCDPVFLLSKQEWKQLCLQRFCKYVNKKYILIYNLGRINKQLIAHAQLLAKEKNMKIYVVKTSEALIKADKVFSNIGPLEFISLIRYASIVLSNSFHATAFSLIFEKEFFTYSFQQMSSSSRMIDLLTLLGLSSRFNPKNVLQAVPLNFVTNKEYAISMINDSKQWLLNQIQRQK